MQPDPFLFLTRAARDRQALIDDRSLELRRLLMEADREARRSAGEVAGRDRLLRERAAAARERLASAARRLGDLRRRERGAIL